MSVKYLKVLQVNIRSSKSKTYDLIYANDIYCTLPLQVVHYFSQMQEKHLKQTNFIF